QRVSAHQSHHRPAGRHQLRLLGEQLAVAKGKPRERDTLTGFSVYEAPCAVEGGRQPLVGAAWLDAVAVSRKARLGLGGCDPCERKQLRLRAKGALEDLFSQGRVD